MVTVSALVAVIVNILLEMWLWPSCSVMGTLMVPVDDGVPEITPAVDSERFIDCSAMVPPLFVLQV